MANLDHISAYHYELPDELVASQPADQRTEARLLRLPACGGVEHQHVRDLPRILKAGDLLIFNNARVLPARLRARRKTGGRVEVFVVGTESEGRWTRGGRDFVALLRANKRLREGERLELEGYHGEIEISSRLAHGMMEMSALFDKDDIVDVMESQGETPLPPYIQKARKHRDERLVSETDQKRYQTVYAEQPGAVAAPTAGLHFTHTLLEKLTSKGVHTAELSLLVGIGTFRPVSTASMKDHEMHSEYYTIPQQTADIIKQTTAAGGRIIAVGTTVVRALEASAKKHGTVTAGTDSTDLFIRPGFDFQVVNALITNFHLPASTLLALVSAFGDHERIMSAYDTAVAAKYRFYSYGDCMLVE